MERVLAVGAAVGERVKLPTLMDEQNGLARDLEGVHGAFRKVGERADIGKCLSHKEVTSNEQRVKAFLSLLVPFLELFVHARYTEFGLDDAFDVFGDLGQRDAACDLVQKAGDEDMLGDLGRKTT